MILFLGHDVLEQVLRREVALFPTEDGRLSVLRDCVVLGGQVGIAGHLKIGNQVAIGAKSGVMHDIPDGGKWLGIPAQPDKQAKRQMIAIQLLPELIRRVAALEKQLGVKQKRGKSKT